MGNHGKVVSWANNRVVFSKEDDGRETGRERTVTCIEYLLVSWAQQDVLSELFL